MDTTILLIIIVALLIFGGGGYYGRGRWFLGCRPIREQDSQGLK